MNAFVTPITQTQIIDLLPNSQYTCLLVKQAYSATECQALLDRAHQLGFDNAIEKYPSTYRNNKRLQLDDAELAHHIFEKCNAYFPQKLRHQGVSYQVDSLNSRLRFCQYDKDQWFRIHQDGEYVPDPQHQPHKKSKLTFLLYLNGNEDFEGGLTNFFNNQYGDAILASNPPEQGDLLIFSHDVWHSGEPVTQGKKYILRSDVIYQADTLEITKSHHDGYIWDLCDLGRINNQEYLASASRDKCIKIWHIGNSQKMAQKQDALVHSAKLQTHENSVFSLTVDDEKNLYGVSRDGYMSKWRLVQNTDDIDYELDYKVDTNHPTALSVQYINGCLYTTGSDGFIRKWRIDGTLLATTCDIRKDNWVWKVIPITNKHTRQAEKIVSISNDGYVTVWQADDLTCLQRVNLQQGALCALTCVQIPSGYQLLIGTESGKVLCVNDTLEIKKQWQAHKDIIRDIVIDQGTLYSCGEDNKVNAFSLDGEFIAEQTTHESFVTSLLVKNNQLFSGGYDGYVMKCLLPCRKSYYIDLLQKR